jgi:predicted nuclease with RNAse H fold
MGERTIGVDLSAQPNRTAACVLEWRPQEAKVLELVHGLTDDDFEDIIGRHNPTKVAIDAPFGWPAPFVAAVARYPADGEWIELDTRPLVLRTTDLAVQDIARQRPLSVSSDRIAVCAMRCGQLLTRLAKNEPLDRTGGGLVAEVYPAAALRMWSLDPRGYKGNKPGQREKRKLLTRKVAEATSGWLPLSHHLPEIAVSDHLLDALISALIGRAVDLGSTLEVPVANRQLAAVEGWIHLPRREPLADFWPFKK